MIDLAPRGLFSGKAGLPNTSEVDGEDNEGIANEKAPFARLCLR